MVKTSELDLGQVVVFKAYLTMTIFCGIDRSRIKGVLLWSEESGSRWISEKWFTGRYAKLGYAIPRENKDNPDYEYKEYKGLVCEARDIDDETLTLERTKPVRYFEESMLQDEMIKAQFHRAVKHARSRFEAGVIEFYSPPIPCKIMCWTFVVLMTIIMAIVTVLILILQNSG